MNNLAALIGIDNTNDEDSKEDDGFKLNLFQNTPAGIGKSS